MGGAHWRMFPANLRAIYVTHGKKRCNRPLRDYRRNGR
jgi:hypothetical protein